MSWEPVGFILFSTIEGIGIFALMLSIFRLKATDYAWPALFVISLMVLQSYVLRNVLEFGFLVPIINIVLFILLLVAVIRIPVLWSAVITLSGYLAFTIIQMGLVVFLFGESSNLDLLRFNAFSMQLMSGLLSVGAAYLLYKFGIGFMFDFGKLRFRWEGITVGLLILSFLLSFSYLMYINQLEFFITFLPFTLLFLLYYAFQKEKMND